MSQSEASLEKTLLENALDWFRSQFRQQLVNPIENQFPNYPLPREIQTILRHTEELIRDVQGWQGSPLSVAQVGDMLSKSDPNRHPFFKQIVCLYRRSRAAETEHL